MKLKKYLSVLVLTIIGTSTFNVNANPIETTINEDGETVYTQTMEYEIDPLGRTREAVKYGDSSLGLYLGAGQTGESRTVNFNFSLPSNAKVERIEIDPGRGVSNGNSNMMIGAILMTELTLTAPNGNKLAIPWSAIEMNDSSYFKGLNGDGKWSIKVKGQNIAPRSSELHIEDSDVEDAESSSDERFIFPSSDGSLIYSDVRMKIEYTLN
ncbi:MAG: hypothetical protein ATN32_05255 [Candidatus Epulonipiscium fishelsonii]|nr:MAG: hypothetical protein ATN32_05255 [Epulopiscium sp. AS2M-Bin002]